MASERKKEQWLFQQIKEKFKEAVRLGKGMAAVRKL
jgi:hypothetical protein